MAQENDIGEITKKECFSVVLYKEEGKVGELLDFTYGDGCCYMDHLFWGSKVDYEYNKRGEVEQNYYWDEENTKLLMQLTKTRSGEALVKAIYKRFHKEKSNASTCIRTWCEKNNIEVNMQVWY